MARLKPTPPKPRSRVGLRVKRGSRGGSPPIATTAAGWGFDLGAEVRQSERLRAALGQTPATWAKLIATEFTPSGLQVAEPPSRLKMLFRNADTPGLTGSALPIPRDG